MALDGLGEKLKSFFKPKEDPRFKGQGRKLGSAEAVPSSGQASQRHVNGTQTKASPATRASALDSGGHVAAGAHIPNLQPPPQPLGPGGRPCLLISRSHRTEDVVLDAAVMVTNTPTGREASLVAAHGLPVRADSPSSPWPAYSAASQAAGGASSSPTYAPAAGGDGGGAAGTSTAAAASAANPPSSIGTTGGEGGLKRSGEGLAVEVPGSGGGTGGGGSGGGAPGEASQRERESQEAARRLQSRINSNMSSIVSTISTPTAAEKRIGGGFRCHAPPTDGAMADYGVAPATSEAYELQRCLALVLSYMATAAAAAGSASRSQPQIPPPLGGTTREGAPQAAVAAAAGPRECCDALLRVLRNVLTKPGETKYRQIRLSNPRVQETIVGVPGAVEFLEAAGFKMQFAPDDGSETANEGYLVLPEEVPPTALAEAFRTLSAAMAAHGFTTASAGPEPGAAVAAPAAAGRTAVKAGSSRFALAPAAAAAEIVPAVDRSTQVLLPAAPDVEVPDWFFERTGAEVRAQWQAAVRKRQDVEQFMTRTMREVRRQQEEAAAGVADGNSPDVATIRVRFPEGVCLQGQFGASEPVSRVFEWVAASLRSPVLTFELIKPDRRPLLTTATATAASSKGTAAAAAGPPAAANRPRPGAGPLTIRGADLLPSVLLNLRPVGQEAAALAAAKMPLLSDELLRTTRPQ